jgi:TetR/AcrR family transcriptional regulator, transcriptional repressor for nem operon
MAVTSCSHAATSVPACATSLRQLASRRDRSPIILILRKRLRAYFDATIAAVRGHDIKNACLVGNFAAEASDHSEIIRKRLAEIYSELREDVAYCLRAAVKQGELPRNFKVAEVANFMVTGLQGAFLVTKVERDLAYAENFKKTLFSTILAR